MKITFNSSGFFNLGEDETIRRSSISERLSKMDPSYFRELYKQMYGQLLGFYDKTEVEKYNLIRMDSTIISEASSRLKEGIDQKNGKQMIKFRFSFDGILPSGAEVFNTQEYSSEDVALPEAILRQVKNDQHHGNIYIIDRGLQSTRNMKELDEKSVKFNIRSKENRKFEELEFFLETGKPQAWGD